MPLDNRKKKEKLDEVVKAIDEPVEEVKVEEPVENLEEKPDEPIAEPEVKTEEPVEEKKEEVKVEPVIDYEQKYKESTKEGLTQYFKNEKLKETIEQANNLPEPTEDELIVFARSKGTNYDDLDDFSKAILKETLWNKNKTNKINEIVQVSKDIDAWADKVEAFANSVETVAKYPLVEENAEEFKRFCMKSARRGMDMEDLATSFLYGLSNIPVKKPSKGAMFLSGGNSSVKEEKPAGLNEDDAMRIRESNPKEYARLIKAGKIKIEL